MDKDNWKKFYEICGVSIGDTVIVDMEELNIESDGIYTVTTEEANDYMEDLLKGNFIIKPWKPNEGEQYYFVSWDYEGHHVLKDKFSYGSRVSLFNIIIGNAFRTKEEAESNKEHIEEVIRAMAQGKFEFKILD